MLNSNWQLPTIKLKNPAEIEALLNALNLVKPQTVVISDLKKRLTAAKVVFNELEGIERLRAAAQKENRKL